MRVRGWFHGGNPFLFRLAAVIAVVALSGCASVQRLGAAYEDAFVPLESIGRFDRWRQKATMEKLIEDGHPFSLVEIGRRFEGGLNGLPMDRACAGFWYERAFATSYEEVRYNFNAQGQQTGSWTQTRAGLPQARVAYRKLTKIGPVEHLDPGAANGRCGVRST